MSELSRSRNYITSQLLQMFQPNQFLPGLTAGLVNGILVIIIQISFAAMIFSSNFPDHVAAGIGLTLFGGFTISLITALTSSFYGSVALPQDSPAAILAVVAPVIAASLPVSASAEEAFLTLVATIIISSLITGVCLFILGQFKLGFLVRFLPYPVIGGFLAGSGWLLVLGGIGITTDTSLSLAQLPQLFQPELLVKWIPSLVFAGLLLAALRRYSHFLLMPSLLLAAVGLFYLILFLTNRSLSTATAQGWLLEPFSAGSLWQPLLVQAFDQADWPTVLGQSGNIGTILLISVISLLLNVSGLELTVQEDIDLNHELQVAGIANVVAGLGGSPAGFQALSLSALSNRLGSHTRLGGLVTATLCGATLLFGASMLSLFPKPVLGGLILFLGLDFLVSWTYDTWFKLPKSEYALITLILVIIGIFGLLTGVTLGLLAAIVLFVINYSRVNVVKHALSRTNYYSAVTRPHLYERLLRQKGDWLYILKLHGFIFFGTAHQLLNQLHQRIDDPDRLELRFVVFDFQQVTGLDSSAVFSFAKMKQLAQRQNFIFVFTHLSPQIQHQLEKEIFVDQQNGLYRIFDDLDHGLEWCENEMIKTFESVGLASKPKTLPQFLADLLPDGASRLFADLDEVDEKQIRPASKKVMDLLESLKFEHEERPGPIPSQTPSPPSLMNYLEREEVGAGHYLIYQGDSPQGLYFIARGQVTVQFESEDGTVRRLQKIEAGTVVGEVGLYSGRRAPASVVTNQPSTIYYLSLANLQKMEEEDPEAVILFHKFMGRLLSEQVANLYATVQTLQD